MGSRPVSGILVVYNPLPCFRYPSHSVLSAQSQHGSSPRGGIYFRHRQAIFDPEGELSKTLGPSALKELASHTTGRTNTQQRCSDQSMDLVLRECSASSLFLGEEGRDDGVEAFGPTVFHSQWSDTP